VDNIDYNTLGDLQMDLLQTCEDANVDCFILDEGGQCYENRWDKIFPRVGLSTDVQIIVYSQAYKSLSM
jgi:hypothetical protein